MSLDRLYAKTVVTVDDVVEQIKPILKLPLEQRHSIFYQRNLNPTDLSQGDIIRLELLQKNIDEENGAIELEECSFGLLVSNTCDLQPDREDFISVLPLVPLTHPSEIEFSNHQHKSKYLNLFQNITEYNNTAYFYLPPAEKIHPKQQGWPGMYGTFQQIQPYPSKILRDQFSAQPSIVMASLLDPAYFLFLLKFSVHFLRVDERFASALRG